MLLVTTKQNKPTCKCMRKARPEEECVKSLKNKKMNSFSNISEYFKEINRVYQYA